MAQRDRGRGRAVPARYAPAFLQYLSEGGERGRRAAYELGRRAISERLSILDLARIHHTVLLDVLKTHRTPHELEHIAQAASEFLVEALAVFEMTQRGFTELLSADRTHQDQLRELQDLEQRMAIEQAKGMLMERHGLSAGSAEERIRQMAARQGITVDEGGREARTTTVKTPAAIRTIADTARRRDVIPARRRGHGR